MSEETKDKTAQPLQGAVLTVEAHGDDIDHIPPIEIAFFPALDDPNQVDLIVHVPNNPKEIPASTALLQGLAVLALEREGYVNKAIDRMFPNGRPTEREAVEFIHLLLQQEVNAKPV